MTEGSEPEFFPDWVHSSNRPCIGQTYAQIEAQLIAMHLDDPKRLPKETMPTPESMVRDGWAKPCPKHPGYFIAGDG